MEQDGVIVFDDDQPRPRIGSFGANRIETALVPGRIYGYNNETSGFQFIHMAETPEGVFLEDTFRGVVSHFGTDIAHDQGIVVSTAGHVVEAEPALARPGLQQFGLVRPDVLNGRIHMLDQGTLTTYAYGSLEELGSLAITGTWDARALVRFGPDGMAFGGGTSVVFIRSGLIGG